MTTSTNTSIGNGTYYENTEDSQERLFSELLGGLGLIPFIIVALVMMYLKKRLATATNAEEHTRKGEEEEKETSEV